MAGKTAFKKGKSGNPAGRPKIPADAKALARAATKPAVAALVAALKVKTTRVPAAIALLDRGWGRATQSIEADVNVDIRLVPDDRLNARLTQLLRKAGISADLGGTG